MKKYAFIFIATALVLTAFAFTSNKSESEGVILEQYDKKIQNLKREIQDLNENGQHRAAKLDSLLNTI